MSETEEQPILLIDEGNGFARIRFNRPAQRNAMNRAARTALVDAFDACRDWAHVVVLEGSGPAFCAGVDLKEPQSDVPEGRSAWRAVQEAIRDHPAVFIASVNGFALGGGVTLINACDLAVAAAEAQIGMPEIGFGAYPALAGPSTQLRLSRKHAAWLVLTARRIDGVTAERWGLVNQCVPLEQLAATIDALARHIASFDPVALEMSKRALWTIPSHIDEWSAAFLFGEHTSAAIRQRSRRTGATPFAEGTRTVGQGAGGA